MPDTVFIRSDSMVVSKDLKVSLRFYSDRDSQEVAIAGLVDSAGYKYKSVWVANANRAPNNDSAFYRQYPSLDTSFLRWNGYYQDCQVAFVREALYAVGGLLTMECKGKLKPVANINNSFMVVTDSITANGDSIMTKRILIDSDPNNSLFLDSLEYDIIKATAWKEGAGSVAYPPHQVQAKLNHYWNDTHTPCENGGSTATGIMQMLRTEWDDCFAGLLPNEPLGYTQCNWDSVAWNWKININNGRYIFMVNNFFRINLPTNSQRNWDSLYFPETDYTPDVRNKEDLSAYGYKWGAGQMMSVKTLQHWNNKVRDNIDVVNTRKYKHERPWNQ